MKSGTTNNSKTQIQNLKTMKKITMIALFAGKPQEETLEESLIDDMQDKGADIKIKDDGDKIKMETEDEKIKIKTDDDGNVKIKVKDKE